MRSIVMLTLLAFTLLFGWFPSNARCQTDPAEEETTPSLEDLNKELKKTLDAVKSHFERIQTRLDEAGVERDPLMDEAIEELEKEQDSMVETLKSLGALLLKAHRQDEQEGQSGDLEAHPSYEEVVEKSIEVIDIVEAYIKEREEYWNQNQTDPETMLQEELKKLQQEEELLEDTLQGLTSALEDIWEEVLSGWGDALRKWEESLKDLVSEE